MKTASKGESMSFDKEQRRLYRIVNEMYKSNTKEEALAYLKRKVIEQYDWTVAAVKAIYKRQTAAEKEYGVAVERNNMGFSKYHAAFMTEVAKEVEKTGRIPVNMFHKAVATISYYVEQLYQISVETVIENERREAEIERLRNSEGVKFMHMAAQATRNIHSIPMSHERCYAGIGSRETPRGVLTLMEDIGGYLASNGWTLRSGHADGADTAFERGCDLHSGAKQIFIPWSGYNGYDGAVGELPHMWYQIAQQFHPNWDACRQGARKLHARNTPILLGPRCDSYSRFVICWTANGSGEGGTGQGLRIAHHYHIPVLDLGRFGTDYNRMVKEVNIFLDGIGQQQRIH